MIPSDTESLLKKCIPYALKNSIAFIVKQLSKFAHGKENTGKPHPCPLPDTYVLEQLLTDRRDLLFDYAKEVFACYTGRPLCFDDNRSISNPTETYLDRIVDQIFNGIQLEVSDFQHVLAYTDTNRKTVWGYLDQRSIFMTPDRKEIRFVEEEGGSVRCIKGLTRELMWKRAIAEMSSICKYKQTPPETEIVCEVHEAKHCRLE